MRLRAWLETATVGGMTSVDRERVIGMTSVDRERVIGMRVVRGLRASEHREVLLVHDDVEDAPRVVTLLTGSEVVGRWAGELAALEGAAGPHVVRVLDAGEAPGGYAIVTEHLPGPSIAELLARRDRLDLGEIVTIVAPTAAAIERLHDAGVAHGAVTARHVRLSADGAPTLVGFGHARTSRPSRTEAELARDPAVAGDREQLRQLTLDLVADAGRARATPAVAVFLERLRAIPTGDAAILRMCTDEIFFLAVGQPIGLDRHDPIAAIRLGHPDDRPEEIADLPTARPGGVGILVSIIPEAWRQTAAARAEQIAIFRDQIASLRTRAEGKGRLALVGLVVAAVLGAGVIAWPAMSAPADSALADPSLGEPVQSTDGAISSSSAGPMTLEELVVGDDPAIAAETLLAVRRECLRALDEECLTLVDAPGSPILADDLAIVRTAEPVGGQADDGVLTGPIAADTLTLIDDWGGSVLLGAGQGAERLGILLVRHDEGWRLRDVTRAAAG